jgi:DNA-binding PadR family transcriptional regulator
MLLGAQVLLRSILQYNFKFHVFQKNFKKHLTINTIRIILNSIMSEKRTLSTLTLAILGLIAEKPQSGYDIRKAFSTTPLGHFSSSPGAIYPALRRIEKSGWISSKIEKKKPLRPRQVFKLTAKGKEVLKKYLLQPVTRNDVIWKMDDLMLRFAFMGNMVNREESLNFLSEFLAEVESYIVYLRQHLESLKNEIPTHGKLAMENGIGSYEMNARWAKRAVRELKKF